MTNILANLLILVLLFDDDEPINLILKEAQITEKNIYLLKEPYKNSQITQYDIKEALKELKQEKLVIVLNEKGEKSNFNDVEFRFILDSRSEWEYWFRITELGKEYFNNRFSDFFHKELINS